LLGVLAGVFLAAGLVFSSFVLTRAWMMVAKAESISVTGSARKNVRSDLIVWRGTFSSEAATLLETQRALKEHQVKVEQFLRAKGFPNFLLLPIAIEEVRARQKGQDDSQAQRTVAYRLRLSVEIRSTEVDKVEQLGRDANELVEQGVPFVSGAPNYIYTKAGEAKVEMLAEATRDARARAEQIASQGGRQIGALLSAKMGVFQITPLYSRETSWEGMNDTTALEKTVTAVVSAVFSMK
jgi:hypothetical protein